MINILKYSVITVLIISFHSAYGKNISPPASKKPQLAYVLPDSHIPFWNIMAKGIKKTASQLGYEITVYDAKNTAKLEIQFTAKALRDKVSGLIISPSNSSACVTLLKLAKQANIPVVISDVGTDGGQYVSYISSNNEKGSYLIGQLLAKHLLQRGWKDGSVGIIAIPQKRQNGQLRTIGFMRAIDQLGIKNTNIKQLVTWTTEETYQYTQEMLQQDPHLRAIWLQTSNIYKGALQAIIDSGKQDQVLLFAFDAEPEFLQLIPQGVIVASGMQQPYLMGQTAVQAMDNYLHGIIPEKNITIPILIVSAKTIAAQWLLIQKRVLGFEN